MGNYIKYKRFKKSFEKSKHEEEIQNFFDELIQDGWEILSYKEKIKKVSGTPANLIKLTIVCGKKQSIVL
ncbi:MAG: hypothetical protein JW866_00025 [Ignavibacteriales bacterium]|nr:hypothetical protein [Ignavibacteriales bacterium]